MATNLQTLMDQREKIEQKINAERDRLKGSVRESIMALLDESAFTLEDIFDVKAKRASAQSGLYQDPDNPENTWGGRGRTPSWLANKIKDGKNLVDFLVTAK